MKINSASAQAILVSLFVLVVHSSPVWASTGKNDKPLLFLGNHQLPPMIYTQNGEASGVVVEMVEAIAKRMRRPVRFEYLDWIEAQRLVLEGKADALLQINPTAERRNTFDFSVPLLESKFSIFVPYEKENIFSIKGLRGLKVGVEKKGVPIEYIAEESSIKPVVIPDIPTGFKLLAEKQIDAVVVDQWVGAYVLAENGIKGIRAVPEPVAESSSAIAVKKGNTELLTEIDQVLNEIKRDGTYTTILAKWQPNEVIFETRSQYNQKRFFRITIMCSLVLALIFCVLMYREMRQRRRAEKQLRLFIEHAPASLAMFDREMRYLSVSRRWLNDYKIGDRDLIGLSHYEVFPEIPEHWKEFHRRGLNGEVVTNESDRFERMDGSVQWLRWEVRPWHSNTGNIAGILIFTEDITERKQAEEALRRKEEEFRALVENAPDVISLFDRNLRRIYVNAEIMENTGQNAAFMVGKSLTEAGYPDSFAQPLNTALQNVFTTGSEETVELFWEAPKGPIWLQIRFAPLRAADGTVEQVMSIGRDITDRKAAEDALRLSEERFSRAFALNPSAICLTGAEDSRIVDANPAFTSIFGYTREEFEGRTILQLGLWPTPQDRELAVAELRQHGFFRDRFQSMCTKSGELREFLSSAELTTINGDSMIVSTWLDITERKRAETALRESEAKYRHLFQNMTEEVHYWQLVRDESGEISTWRLVDVNPPALTSWGRRSVDEIKGKTTDEIFGEGATEHYLPVVKKIMTDGVPHSFEDYFPHLEKYFRFTSVPLENHFITTGADITEIKKAEKRLQDSLAEKEILLKEIHHRVKNNLQVISSLVDLQAAEVEDPAMRDVFKDVVSRVRTMAMVHEKLYESSDLARIEFAGYVNSLLSYLWRAQQASDCHIQLDLKLEPVSLPVTAAVPCGLILNELFSNALKHAFNGRDSGKVRVSLWESSDGCVCIKVWDDGIGLPVDFDWKKAPSLGLRLVQMLARQLRATVEMESDRGTSSTISFEVKKS